MIEKKVPSNEELNKMLRDHQKWLDTNGRDGIRFDGRYLNLSHKNLQGANLTRAYLGGDMTCTILNGANLTEACLVGTKLINASLRRADLTKANLEEADLEEADLYSAILRGACLTNARLNDARLNNTNFSGAKGLLNPIEFIEKNFERTSEGIIVYKTFSEHYDAPEYWNLKPGAIIEEVVNSNIMNNCGHGVNVATLSWVLCETEGNTIWRCLIKWEWLAGVIVPLATNGKIRASRVQLLEEFRRNGDRYHEIVDQNA